MHASTQWSRRASNPVNSKSFEREWTRGSSISFLERERTRGSSISVLELWRPRKRDFSRILEVWRPRKRDFLENSRILGLRISGLELWRPRKRDVSRILEVWRPRKPGSSRGLAFSRGSWLRREVFHLPSRQGVIAIFLDR